MLLPKRVTRKYTYDETDIESKLYSIETINEAVSTVYMKTIEDLSTKVETVYLKNKVKHILLSNGMKVYLSDKQYFNALKIAFFRNRLHLGKVEMIFNENELIGYQIDTYPLVRKINGHSKTLVKKC